jgi:hypothetical protein
VGLRRRPESAVDFANDEGVAGAIAARVGGGAVAEPVGIVPLEWGEELGAGAGGEEVVAVVVGPGDEFGPGAAVVVGVADPAVAGSFGGLVVGGAADERRRPSARRARVGSRAPRVDCSGLRRRMFEVSQWSWSPCQRPRRTMVSCQV